MSDDAVYQRMFAHDDGEAVTYPVAFGDRQTDVEYAFSDDIELAVNVALATGRPLLVLGPPGSGKTSLGRAVARRLRWDPYETVVTSRTRAPDLLWTFDNVRRLSRAMATRDSGETQDDEVHVHPGVMWWALDPWRAAEISHKQKREVPTEFSDGAVVVIDEIDKADPSVPNDLLRPLGDLVFEVSDLDNELVIRRRTRPPLVFITSNGERTLPPAFLRRCIVIELPGFERTWLLTVAERHFGSARRTLHERVLDELVKAAPVDENGRPLIGTAEYLDVLRACQELSVWPGHERWPLVSGAALLKRPVRSE